jgi:hypothetical protein
MQFPSAVVQAMDVLQVTRRGPRPLSHVDNTVVVAVPGAMDAGLGSALFWLSLAGSLALAFMLTTRSTAG